MFGISLAELLVIMTIAVIFIGPKELPEVARYVTKFIIKIKKVFEEVKTELRTVSDQLGLDEIKSEVEMELMKEKIKLDQEPTTIIDIYGHEHQVYGVDQLRTDKTKEEIEEEIKNYNQINNQINNGKNQP